MDARPSKRLHPAAEPAWSELLPEIAGDILSRIPSYADRVRFRCVCRQWRLAAKQQWWLLPPALPWLTTTWQNTCDEVVFISLPDGARHRLPVVVHAGSRSSSLSSNFHETFDEWLMYSVRNAGDDDGDGVGVGEVKQQHLLLVNPFSAATMTLPGYFPIEICKLFMCPRGRLVAAMVYELNLGYTVALYQPGARSWSVHEPPSQRTDMQLHDIALLGGRLYAFYGHDNLCTYDLDDDDDDGAGTGEPPKVSCHPYAGINSDALLYDYDSDDTTIYIVPSSYGNNRLLLVVRKDDGRFTVFQVDLDADASWWSEVRSLDDQLLFLSPKNSRALRASPHAHGGAMRGNRIFFIAGDYFVFPAQTYEEGYDECDTSEGSGVYDMSSRTISSFFPAELLDNCEARWSWMFPSSAA